jgi:6-pyruvoyltetrahydropterin/6-carboxytetrahydropterin synthase
LFEISVKRRFAAAHRLEGYGGECAALHGHTWTVEVLAAGRQLDQFGMLVDFKVIKEMVDSIISELDHTYLNDLACFSCRGGKKVNPTAENMAVYIYGRVKEELQKKAPAASVRGVKIWESSDASAFYRED